MQRRDHTAGNLHPDIDVVWKDVTLGGITSAFQNPTCFFPHLGYSLRDRMKIDAREHINFVLCISVFCVGSRLIGNPEQSKQSQESS